MRKVVLLPEELVVTGLRKYILELCLFHVTVLNKHAVDYTKYYINLMIVTGSSGSLFGFFFPSLGIT